MIFCFLAAEVKMEIRHALKFNYNSAERTALYLKIKLFFFPKAEV